MRKIFLLLISLVYLLGLGACAGTKTLVYHQWVPIGEVAQAQAPAPASTASPAPAVAPAK